LCISAPAWICKESIRWERCALLSYQQGERGQRLEPLPREQANTLAESIINHNWSIPSGVVPQTGLNHTLSESLFLESRSKRLD
jgi:hypothetical protein